MNHLADPLHRAIDHGSDTAIGHVASRKQYDAGVFAVDGVASLPLQTRQLDLFAGPKGAYGNKVFHGTPPGKLRRRPLEVFYSTASRSCA